MEREVVLIVLLAVAVFLLLLALGWLFCKIFSDYEKKQLEQAKEFKIRQIKTERSEIVEQIEAESKRQ